MKAETKSAILKMAACFVITFVVMGIALWFIRFPSINGESMEPTYHNGDRVLLLHVQSVHRGDVAIVWSNDLDEYVVKRVIGIPGDVIEFKNGMLYRNGVILYETYISAQNWVTDQEEGMIITLGDGEIYLLGDNRINSKDSRVFGPFQISDVFGIVLGS